MNTNDVWAALRRLWAPPPQAPVDVVEEDTIRGEAQVRRALQRLARGGCVLSLQDEAGAFDHPAKLVGDQEDGMALLLPAGADDVPGPMPALLHATACSDKGVLLFSLEEVTRHGRRLQAPLPREIVQVQARRHFRVTGLGGQHGHAVLELPEMGKVPRLRNLSEEGVAFELEQCCLPAGTVVRNAVLRLDDMKIAVPALKVVYCRTHSPQQCTVGAHFEQLDAEAARQLRRWIAAAQAVLMRPDWNDSGVDTPSRDARR